MLLLVRSICKSSHSLLSRFYFNVLLPPCVSLFKQNCDSINYLSTDLPLAQRERALAAHKHTEDVNEQENNGHRVSLKEEWGGASLGRIEFAEKGGREWGGWLTAYEEAELSEHRKVTKLLQMRRTRKQDNPDSESFNYNAGAVKNEDFVIAVMRQLHQTYSFL